MGKIIVGIRHAKPENSSGGLSEEGNQIQREMSARLKSEGLNPSLIYHSPLKRASETAEILSIYLEAPTLSEPALGDDFDPEVILNRIHEAKENQTLFFVGHEPHLAKFMEHLAGEHFLPAGLKKSEAMVLQFEEEIAYGKAKLIKRYQPEL